MPSMTVIEWTEKEPGVFVYVADDLCAGVYKDCGQWWWHITGPNERGTKGSGGIRPERLVDEDAQIHAAKKCAEVFIGGYRAAVRDQEGALARIERRG